MRHPVIVIDYTLLITSVFTPDHPLPRMVEPEPTSVPPGPRKVEVLANRLQAGLPLWHPNDEKYNDESHRAMLAQRRKDNGALEQFLQFTKEGPADDDE